MANKLLNAKQTFPTISPPPPPIDHQPSNTYTYSQTPPRPLSIDIPLPIPAPEPYNKTPSIPFSLTHETDEDNVADAIITSAHSPNFKRSRSRSNSYSESKIERLVRDQEQYKKKHGNQIPKRVAPKTPMNDRIDNDEDDHLFDRILVSLARQESTSKDKRRSASHSRKSPNVYGIYGKIGPILPRLLQHEQLQPTVSKKGTRARRAGTSQLVEPEHSQSHSYFHTLRKCNEINANIALPMRRQKWIDNEYDTHDSEHDMNSFEITPSPKPPSDWSHSIAGVTSAPVYDLDTSQSPPILNDVDSNDIEFVAMPIEMAMAAKSTPNLNVHTMANSKKYTALKPRIQAHHISVQSVDSFIEQNFEDAMRLIGGSRAPNNRGRRSTIRPYGSTPNITRGYSVEDVDTKNMKLLNRNMDMNDNDMKRDIFMDSDDEDNDDNDEMVTDYIIMDDKKEVDPMQSELVFQTTAHSLMVSCGDSREVFAILRKICVTLKKDESLPYTIEFTDKILKYDHVEAFLKLLGFIKNKESKQWICYKENRVNNRLIDCGVLECHKCLLLIQKHASIKALVSMHRKKRNSLSKKSSNHPNMHIKSKSPPFIAPPLPLSIVQQSQSYEESMTVCDYNDDIKNEGDDDDSVQLYELIWSITHNNNDDHQAKDVLLLCYPLVTTAKNILQCCEARFFNDDHDGRITVSQSTDQSSPSVTSSHISFPSFDGNGLSPHMRSSSNTSMDFSKHLRFDRILSSFTVQAKVIEFIRHWMQRYWDRDWHSNKQLLSYCKKFSRRVRKAYQSDTDNWDAMEMQRGLRLVEMLEKTMLNQKRRLKLTLNKLLGDENANNENGNKDVLKGKNKKKRHRKTISIFGSYPKLPKTKELVDINYVIIAEQITVTQFHQFKAIHPRECLNQSWKNLEKKDILAPNITQYIDSFNRLTKWIQSSILVAENVKIRGKTIKKWVKVEQELYKLRNFQALCAVYAALASTPIWKLKEAWANVSKKYIAQHDMIKVIMKSTGNWKNLRRLQLETHPPMLPYFGMFAQDLIAIGETTNNRMNDGSINWDVLWRVNAAIDKHLIYQNTAYNNLTEDATIQRWMQKELNMSGKLDNEWVYEVSTNVSKKDKAEVNKRKHKKSSRSIFNTSK